MSERVTARQRRTGTDKVPRGERIGEWRRGLSNRRPNDTTDAAMSCNQAEEDEEEADTVTSSGTTRGRDGQEEAVVFAWWAGYGEETDRRGRKIPLTKVHLYATRLSPTRPLDIGSTVRLVALAKTIPPIPLGDLDQYLPYDPHVVGKVNSIVGFGGGWVRVTVGNTCGGNEVETVGIDIPHVPGVTVRRTWLGGPEACLQWIGRTPDGDLEQLGKETARGLCAADTCWLRQMDDPADAPFRAWPAGMEEREKRRPRKGAVGVAARHKWLVE
ncbi:hypothetical protein OH76DRAFT_1422849 [Lentinus brumalis]|uniref:Uncharacterized protein n=1 Tax=Lentinus brumalis TaxID=2498619 RepID=A0A371CNW3_9APHY|nr:hypothetical protein OH76DRAFT_1422849 [Polyporus brumalis]